MIDPIEVAAKPFNESHLFNKLRKEVVVSRIFLNRQETSSLLYAVTQFNIDNPLVYSQVEADYGLYPSYNFANEVLNI